MLRILFLGLYAVLSFSANAQLQGSRAEDAFLVTRMVEKFHVQPRPLDKTMSEAIYQRILLELDGEKILFTSEDLAKLAPWRSKLNEEILSRQTNFLQLITGIYKHRLEQVDTMAEHLTVRPFAFTGQDKLTALEDTTYPANDAALRTKVYKLMKLYVANRLAEHIISRGGVYTSKTIDSLEPKLRQRAVLSIRRMIKRVMQSPTGVDNIVGIVYCQALAVCYDPHTEYLSPDEKAAWESALGQKPLSYGLLLKDDEDGHAIIAKLIPGGPAFFSGALNEGDRLLSVRWDTKDSIDVSDASAEELQQTLGDEGGRLLTIQVRKKDGTSRQVGLQKQQVNLTATDEEENKVKGFLLKGTKTVGYISLPAFYEDWENNSGVNGCANDVAKEILKLKKENIGALILDLRYNGGGSIEEAVDLSGLFIDAGAVGQIKSREPKAVTLKDINRGTVWDGPLLVLVNGSSASASEMVAGTLQDYHRALIIGSPTYGKATAQVILPMDTTIDLEKPGAIAAKAASYIKVTISKLYRVDGRTAQFSGVQPDIVLPEPPAAMTQRESDEPSALAPTPIDGNKYYRPLPVLPIAAEQSIADQAIAASAYFQKAKQTVRPTSKKITDYSLNLNDIIAAGKGKKDADVPRENQLFTVANPAYEEQRLQTDETVKKINETRKKTVQQDPYLGVTWQLAVGLIK